MHCSPMHKLYCVVHTMTIKGGATTGLPVDLNILLKSSACFWKLKLL